MERELKCDTLLFDQTNDESISCHCNVWSQPCQYQTNQVYIVTTKISKKIAKLDSIITYKKNIHTL